MARNIISKEEILDTGYKMALKDGLQAISARNVAKETGVAVGTLYNYYPSVDDLTLAITEKFFYEAFKDTICVPQPKADYLGYIKEIMPIISDVLNSFDQNWLAQIHAMNANAKAKGVQLQSKALKHATAQLSRILESDPNAHTDTLPNNITTTDIAEFTLRTMLACIRENRNPQVLFYLLENTLYRN